MLLLHDMCWGLALFLWSRLDFLTGGKGGIPLGLGNIPCLGDPTLSRVALGLHGVEACDVAAEALLLSVPRHRDLSEIPSGSSCLQSSECCKLRGRLPFLTLSDEKMELWLGEALRALSQPSTTLLR